MWIPLKIIFIREKCYSNHHICSKKEQQPQEANQENEELKSRTETQVTDKNGVPFSYLLRWTPMACQGCYPANQCADKKITTWTSLSQTQRDPKNKNTNLSNIQAFRGGSRSWGPWTRIWRRQRAKRAGRRKRDERSSKWTMWKMKSEKNPLTASEGRSARRISKRRLVARRAAGENMVGDRGPGTNEVIREIKNRSENKLTPTRTCEPYLLIDSPVTFHTYPTRAQVLIHQKHGKLSGYLWFICKPDNCSGSHVGPSWDPLHSKWKHDTQSHFSHPHFIFILYTIQYIFIK